MDFNPGAGVYNMSALNAASGSTNGFVLALDSNGNFIKAFNFGGADNEQALRLLEAIDGKIVVQAKVNGTADLDPGATTFNYTSVGNLGDPVIITFDTNGTFVNAVPYAIVDDHTQTSFAKTTQGDYIVAGYFFTDSVNTNINGAASYYYNNKTNPNFSVADMYISKVGPASPLATTIQYVLSGNTQNNMYLLHGTANINVKYKAAYLQQLIKNNWQTVDSVLANAPLQFLQPKVQQLQTYQLVVRHEDGTTFKSQLLDMYNSQQNSIVIYPTNATNKLFITNNGEVIARKIHIINAIGTPMISTLDVQSKHTLSIDLSHWPVGTYFVRPQNGLVQKFTKH
jgi:Secretion system C-terminal sorting domain